MFMVVGKHARTSIPSLNAASGYRGAMTLRTNGIKTKLYSWMSELTLKPIVRSAREESPGGERATPLMKKIVKTPSFDTVNSGRNGPPVAPS